MIVYSHRFIMVKEALQLLPLLRMSTSMVAFTEKLMYVKYSNRNYLFRFLFMQINDDGIISFGSPYISCTPLPFPLNSIGAMLIAPYWADVDTKEIGDIYYRQTTDPSLLARATSEIRAAFPTSGNVTIKSLLIATWDNVGYWFQKLDKVLLQYAITTNL